MKQANLKAIGKVCQNARKRAGFTQDGIAEAMNCSKSQVSGFEVGRINSLSMFSHYARRFLSAKEIDYIMTKWGA